MRIYKFVQPRTRNRDRKFYQSAIRNHYSILPIFSQAPLQVSGVEPAAWARLLSRIARDQAGAPQTVEALRRRTLPVVDRGDHGLAHRDRTSTRLNSSHVRSSY